LERSPQLSFVCLSITRLRLVFLTGLTVPWVGGLLFCLTENIINYPF
jgi:hypothetical protein